MVGTASISPALFPAGGSSSYTGTLTLSGLISGTGALAFGSTLGKIVDTGGTFLLSGGASHSGGTSLRSGTLVLAAADASGSGPVDVGLGTLMLEAGATAGAITVSAKGTIIDTDAALTTFQTPGSTLTYLNGAIPPDRPGGDRPPAAWALLLHGKVRGATSAHA